MRKNRVSTASGKDYVSGFLFDVTEMKRREVEADEARKQLADVLERMPAGVVIYDRDDNFVFANRKLQESLPALKSIWQPGRTLRDAFDHGHSVGYFRSSGDPQVDELYDVDKERWIEAILARYHLRHFEFERQNPDGRWYQVYDMRTDDGTFIGVRVDITELKRREKALRDSMRQIDLFRHVLDELPVAAFIKSDDLRIEYVNKAWSSITGISKEEAVGHTDLELFGGDEAQGYTACRRRGQRHRQGRRDGRAGHPSRRHRQAADDPQEPAGGDRRVGAPGRIEHRHHRREGAREPAQRKPARERGVPQPDRQRAGGDLRQAARSRGCSMSTRAGPT